MYSTPADASRPQSPGAIGTTTASRPTPSGVAELLRTADTDERCTEAAVTFARACADFPEGSLRELLSGLPAEAPLPLLCQKLADALASEKVTSAIVWNELLHVIRSDTRLANAQLALHQHCAQCLAELHVTDATVWSQVAALPTSSPDALVQAGAQIAASMARAGVEAPVLWDTLIAAMAQVPAGAQVGHAQMAQGLVQAGVGCAAAWTALWRHCEARYAGGPARHAVVAAAMSMLIDQREVSGFAAQVGVASLLNAMQHERITDPAAWSRAFGAAAGHGQLVLAMSACTNERDSSIRRALLSEIAKAAADGACALKPLFMQCAQQLADWSGQDTPCATLVDGLTDQLVAQCGPQGRSDMLALARQCAPRATGAPSIGRRIVDQLLVPGPAWSAADLNEAFKLLDDLRSPLPHWYRLVQLVAGEDRSVLRGLLGMGRELAPEHWKVVTHLATRMDGASANQLYLDCVRDKVRISDGAVPILEKLGEAALAKAQSGGAEALLDLAEGMVARHGNALPALTLRAVTEAITAAQQSGELQKSAVLSRVIDMLVQWNERAPEVWAMLPTLVTGEGHEQHLAQYEKLMKVFTYQMKEHPDCQRLAIELVDRVIESATGQSLGSLVDLAQRISSMDKTRAMSLLAFALQQAKDPEPRDLVKVGQLLTNDDAPSSSWRQLWRVALSLDAKVRRDFYAALAHARLPHQSEAFETLIDVAKDQGCDALIEVTVHLSDRSQDVLSARALSLALDASKSSEGPQLIPLAQMLAARRVASPDDAARLASLLVRAARGCDAAQLLKVVEMATMLAEPQQAQLWEPIWHAALQLDATSLRGFYDSLKTTLRHLGGPLPLNAVAWTKLIEAAKARGFDALTGLASVLDVRNETAHLATPLSLALEASESREGPQLIPLAQILARRVDSPDDAARLASMLVRATRGCDATQLLQVAKMATVLPEQQQARLWESVWHAAESLEGPQLIPLAQTLPRRIDSPDDAARLASLLVRAARGCGLAEVRQVVGMAKLLTALEDQKQAELGASIAQAWARLVEVAHAQGFGALIGLASVLKGNEAAHLVAALRLATDLLADGKADGSNLSAADFENVLKAARTAGIEWESPLLHRLTEALSGGAALAALPFMLLHCAHAAGGEVLAPLSLLALTLGRAMRTSPQRALNALLAEERAVFHEEKVFRGPGQDRLVDVLIELVFEKPLAVHKACRAFGAWNLCNIVLNTQTSPYARPYRAMILNALADGTLKLDEIEEISGHRALVRKAVPGIRWDLVFNPGAGAPTSQCYVGFPQLQQVAIACVKSLQDLTPGLARWGANLQKRGINPDDPRRKGLADLNTLLKDLLVHLCPEFTRAFLSKIVNDLWGLNGSGILINERLMSRLIAPRQASLHSVVVNLMPQLLAQLNLVLEQMPVLIELAGAFESPVDLAKVSESFRAAWGSLATLVAHVDFAKRYAMGGDYIISLIKPDDASNLILGHTVACCGSPKGEHPELILERLAGGWVLWTIANKAGETAAVAWATLNEEQDLVIDFVDERVSFRDPPLGNDLVEALFAFGPKLAAAIGANRVWGAPNRQGRLENFDAFKRPMQMQTFRVGVPSFMGKAPYTDSLNKGTVGYFIIDRQ